MCAWFRLLIGWIIALLCLVSGEAMAQVVITEFGDALVSQPRAITAGADGNLWFTEPSGNRIGRISPSGAVTEFSAGITAGAVPVRHYGRP